ncbi:DNA cytosine methyltransferase [Deinococcus sp. VB142]|uniref:DNA (cytosine-5-)-methyltransferase n=1 Tax=Deinococcus sp. VB142 TaxID=3112952 RepID=A0AAU6Q034_9DEIO
MRNQKSKSSTLIGIDLFSGAGGMSIGAEMAGVEVAVAVELDKWAGETFRANHKQANLILKDVRDLESVGDLRKGRRIVFGGPPCQGFSTSNQRNRSKENINNWLFKDYLRLAMKVSPDWIVFENVKGIFETAGGIFMDEILSGFEGYGYTTSWFILDASDYGVPQRRNRLFIIASREGIVVQPPAKAETTVSVRDAIQDLPSLTQGASICEMPYSKTAESAYARGLRQGLTISRNNLVSKNNDLVMQRYKYIKQGQNFQSIPAELMSNYANSDACHTGIYYRLKEDEPSIVIGNYRKNMLIHPWEDRGLSVREAARLQSFPDDFIFYGSIGFQQQQVANAVPPLLAKAVFQTVLRY